MRFTEKLAYPLKNSPFYCRPLALICGLFLCALFLKTMSIIAFLGFAIGFSVYVIYRVFSDKKMKKGRNPLAYLMMIAVVLGSLAGVPNESNYRNLQQFIDTETETKAVILDEVYSETFGYMYKAGIISVNGIKYKGNCYLVSEQQAEFFAYDTVTVKAIPTDAREKASGGELLTLKAENICLEFQVNEVLSITNESKKGIDYSFFKLRQAMGARLRKVLNAETAAYANALILGEKSGLDQSFRRDMSAVGISHILAVSGMHTSIIAAMITFVAERLKTHRKSKSIIIIAGAVFFSALAGFSPSVTRATVMLIFGVLPVFFGGRGDSITALFFAGALICAVSPETVISCGFLLSFSATLGIVVCASYVTKTLVKKLEISSAGHMKHAIKWLNPLLLAVIISLSASLFTVPVLSMYFNEASFFSVIMNIIAVPLATISMTLVIATLIFANAPILNLILPKALEWVYAFLKGSAAFVTDRISVTVSLRYPFFPAILILLGVLLLFLRLRKSRNPLGLLGVFVVCATVFAVSVQIYSFAVRDRAEVCYVANKSAEGILVNSGNETLYIDIGNGSKTVPAEAIELASNEYCETGLDGFMLTHYHSAHIATLRRFLNTYRIQAIYLPYPDTEKDRSFYENMLPYIEGCSIIMYQRGDILSFGNAEIQTCPQTFTERSEHPVIAMKIGFGDRSVTYVGSSVSESELAPMAETLISESGSIICGRHGPVTKEQNKFYLFKENTNVYLSPYEDTDEKLVFPNGRYNYIEADEEGLAVFKLIIR